MSAFAQLWDAPAANIDDPAEEAVLIKEAQTGDEAATLRLFSAYVRSICSAISAYVGRLSLDDARQAALVGFLELIRDHDASRGERLAGKVRVRLHDALSEAASAEAGGFTVPARTLRRFFGVLRAADGDAHAAAKLAAEHDLAEENFWAILDAVRAGSLDTELMMNGDVPMWEITTPRAITDAEDAVLVAAAFRAVDDREQDVCRMAYGFTDYGDPVPDAEIAHRIGGSRDSVLRTRHRALRKMREALFVS